MYTSENVNLKSRVINNVMLQMSMYVDKDAVDVLQRVLEEQFVFLNMEQITTLPAEIDRSVEEKNRYLLGLYQVKKRNLAQKTVEQYVRAVRSLASVIDKAYTDMDELDVDYYLRWYAQRHTWNNKGQNQASTCNNERRYLSAFFTWLRKERFRTDNPVELTEPLKEVQKPIEYFRPAEMEELREGCRNVRDRAIVEVLRSTGARVGEVVAINTADINWQTGDILIQSEKSGRYRTIYLDEVARYHLQKYISQREDEDPALFVACKKPYARLHTSGVRTILKNIAKRAGMSCRVYPHKMRSTLGMNLRNAGVDIGDVSEVLGHANTTVTKRHYAQATPETLRGIRRRAAA